MQATFNLTYDKHTLVGDKLETSDSQIELICLHGAGKAQRSRFKKLRNKLARNRISSLAFDFIGHGDSSGSLGQDSLRSRTQQVLEVIRRQTKSVKNRDGKLNPSILATSMSAYTAIKLTEFMTIKHLILVVPAVYHHKAYRIPFNAGFSEIIRKPNNWINSDAWDLLEKFEGNLFVITAELDDVIPKAIPGFIMDLAINTSLKRSMVVSESTHQIMHHLNDNPEAFDTFTNGVTQFLIKNTIR